MKKKILFVAMQNSTHTARFIKQLSEASSLYDIHLFCVNPYTEHSYIKDVTIHKSVLAFRISLQAIRDYLSKQKLKKNSIQYVYPLILPYILLRIFNRISIKFRKSVYKPYPFYGHRCLIRVIKKIKPDIIHSLEFQNCGYLVLNAREHLSGAFPVWIACNWGSDIYYFQHFKEHKKYIQKLLAYIDYYQCECERDVKIAKKLGYKNAVLPVMPNTGGFDLIKIKPLREKIKVSERKFIMLKGYQNFAGRALTALKVIEELRDLIKNYTVIVFSASIEVVTKIKILQEKHSDLNFLILPYNTSHESMLKMYAKSRIYIGISVSDAISTSLLEAMAMGTFPIQTNTSCCYEWIKDGLSGFSVVHDDLQMIRNCLKQALSNDKLVNDSAIINWETVRDRLDAKKLRETTMNIYKEIFQ